MAERRRGRRRSCSSRSGKQRRRQSTRPSDGILARAVERGAQGDQLAAEGDRGESERLGTRRRGRAPTRRPPRSTQRVAARVEPASGTRSRSSPGGACSTRRRAAAAAARADRSTVRSARRSSRAPPSEPAACCEQRRRGRRAGGGRARRRRRGSRPSPPTIHQLVSPRAARSGVGRASAPSGRRARARRRRRR